MVHDAAAQYQGACLCGAVRMRVSHAEPHVSACHCNICRHWGGGPFLSLECRQAPEFDGLEHVATFASSDWAERGFCTRCGTHLFYRLKSAEFYAVPVGLFAEGASWPFTLQVFIDAKPENYAFANATDTMTGEEVFKAWS